MAQVITFFFSILNALWAVIYQNWILAMPIMCIIFGMVIDLVKQSRGNN